ncbi:MAG: hypothetical protein AAGC55_25355, partial [Myxococcota bacterium]
INFWRGGWQVGPRYITAMLPFAMVPVAAALGAAVQHRVTRTVAVAVVAVGVVVYPIICAVFPYFPEVFRNPLYELVFRLIGDDRVIYNLGWLFGLRGLASLLPLLMVQAVLLLYVAAWPRGHRLSGLLGLGLAGAIIVGYSMISDGGPAAERTYRWLTTVIPH